AGVDAIGGHARPAFDHQSRVAQVHVLAHPYAIGVDDGVAGGDAVHIQVTVEGDLDPAAVVITGLGHADVAVAGEVHRAVRADVGGIAACIGRGPAGIRGIVGCADRIVDVVVPGATDVAGGDGAVRVELGVAADHVDDRIAHAVQLAAVDGVRAGGADLARGHVGDHHVAGVDAGDGHARPARDHQAGVAQVHIRADRNAGGVDEGVAGGDAVHVQVPVQGDLDHAVLINPGLGHGDVVVTLEVHRAVRPDVHLVVARTGQVPAGGG